MSTALIAHAGHTITTIAYLLPVVGFLGWLAIVMIRDRVRGRDGAGRRSGRGADPD